MFIGALAFINKLFGIGQGSIKFFLSIWLGIRGIAGIGLFIIKAFDRCAAVYTA
jgi:hypothetical protein